MTGLTPEEQRVPPYVALVRIAAVVGMSIFAAMGIFILIGAGSWEWALRGVISLALAIPFFFVMRLVEGTAETTDEEESTTESS